MPLAERESLVPVFAALLSDQKGGAQGGAPGNGVEA